MPDENAPTRAVVFAGGRYHLNSVMGGPPRKRVINIVLKRGLGLAFLLLLIASSFRIDAYQKLARQTSIQAAQATQARKATATAIANAVNAYPAYLPGNGKLLFSDPLQQANNWQQGEDKDFGGSCQFKNGALHAREGKPDSNYGCSSFSSSFTNFALEVQMTIIRGDCGAATFRDSGNKFYYIRICQNGEYIFSKYLDPTGKNTFYFASRSHPAIKKGLNQMNRLAIYANQDVLRVFVNGQQIAMALDKAYTKGSITLGAEDKNNVTEVVYQQAKVWTFS